MKVGVLTVLFQDMPFEKMLDHVAQAGCEAVEIGTGGYPGTAHCDPAEMLKDAAAQRKSPKSIEKRGLILAALSVHGNPLHPQAKTAKAFHDDWRDAAQPEASPRVERVIAFADCLGGSDHASCANLPRPVPVLRFATKERAAEHGQRPPDSWCGQFMMTPAIALRGTEFGHISTCFPEEPVLAQWVSHFTRACSARQNLCGKRTGQLGAWPGRVEPAWWDKASAQQDLALPGLSKVRTLRREEGMSRRRVHSPLGRATHLGAPSTRHAGPTHIRDRVRPVGAAPSVVTPADDREEVFVAYCDRQVTDALKLKYLLESTLGLKAVLLGDEFVGSATLMESLELWASSAAAAIVIMTPDDRVVTEDGGEYWQPRPNVIFEQGWLYAKLGRDRVLTLVEEGTTLHSDVQGIHYLRFHQSVMERSEDIRKALSVVGVGLVG